MKKIAFTLLLAAAYLSWALEVSEVNTWRRWMVCPLYLYITDLFVT